MFEFILNPKYFGNDTKHESLQPVTAESIAIAAERMANDAAALTIRQFNDACEAVVYEKSQHAK